MVMQESKTSVKEPRYANMRNTDVMSLQVSCNCSSECIVPVCQSNVATCPYLPTMAICLTTAARIHEYPKEVTTSSHNSPAVPRVSGPIWTTIQRPFLPSPGCILSGCFCDFALPNPPCLLHLIVNLHQPRLIREQHLRILDKSPRACRMCRLPRELRPELLVGYVGVFRKVFRWW